MLGIMWGHYKHYVLTRRRNGRGTFELKLMRWHSILFLFNTFDFSLSVWDLPVLQEISHIFFFCFHNCVVKLISSRVGRRNAVRQAMSARTVTEDSNNKVLKQWNTFFYWLVFYWLVSTSISIYSYSGFTFHVISRSHYSLSHISPVLTPLFTPDSQDM